MTIEQAEERIKYLESQIASMNSLIGSLYYAAGYADDFIRGRLGDDNRATLIVLGEAFTKHTYTDC